MDNATRKQLLQRHKQSGFPGSIMDVFDAYKKGVDIIGQFEQQQAQQLKVAKTPQEQKQGLRPDHQAGNINQSMAFPNMPPNASFNTMGMKAPIDLKQFDQKGNLVASYDKIPPGVSNLKMSSQGGTVLETPSQMKSGGVRKYQGAGPLNFSATTPDWRTTGPAMRIDGQIYQPSELTGGTRIMANPETGDLLPIMLPAAEVYSDTNDPNALATDSIATALSKTGSGMLNNVSEINDYLYSPERLAFHREGLKNVMTGVNAGAFIGSLGTRGGTIQLGARGVGGLSNSINSASSFLGSNVSNAVKATANAIGKNKTVQNLLGTKAGQLVTKGLEYGQKGLNAAQMPGKWLGNKWNATKLGQTIDTISNTAIPGFSGMSLSSGLKSAGTVLGVTGVPSAIDNLKEGDILGASAKLAKLPGFKTIGPISRGKEADAVLKTGIASYNLLSGQGGIDDVIDMTKTIPGTSNIRIGSGLIKTSNSILEETLKYGGIRKYQKGGEFKYGEWTEVSRKVDPVTGDIIITESRDGSRSSGYNRRGVNWEIGYRRWLAEGNKGSLADFKLAAEAWKKSQSKTEYDSQTRTRIIKGENEPNNQISFLQPLYPTEIPNEYTNDPILNPQSGFGDQIFNNEVIKQPKQPGQLWQPGQSGQLGQLGQSGLGGSGQRYTNQQQGFTFDQAGLTPEELGETIVTTDPVTGEQYVQPFNIQSTSSLDTKSDTTIRGKNKKRTRFKEDTTVAREDGTSSRTKNTQVTRSKTGKDDRVRGKTSYEEFDENGNRIVREVDRFKKGGKRKIKDRRISRK